MEGLSIVRVNIAKIYGRKVSISWMGIALYPTLILYSCLILRRLLFGFLLITVKGIVLWIEDRKLTLSIILIGFLGATFFHGAMSIGLLVFLIIFFIIFLKNLKFIIFEN